MAFVVIVCFVGLPSPGEPGMPGAPAYVYPIALTTTVFITFCLSGGTEAHDILYRPRLIQ